MNLPLEELITDNAAWTTAARPRLSVLIPFHRDDPSELVAALDAQASELETALEIVLLDDGSGDDRLALTVAAAVLESGAPTRLVRRLRNEGRARGRNRLISHARADTLLFLDADMRPAAPDFLRLWLDEARSGAPVVFGGFALPAGPGDRDHAVHRSMALKTECLPAAQRRLAPEKHLFTCNLLVHRRAMEAHAFDPAFTGWGWEDVEWALRVAPCFPIRHVDNPALHLGLDTVEDLARKYEQSVANFQRALRLHHDEVRRFPSYRAARTLAGVPFRSVWRPWLKRIALWRTLPVKLRAFSLRLYRVALYAEATP